MLLKKRVIIIAILFMLLLPVSYAQVCEIGKVKDVLRKILYLHFTGEGDVALKADEVKDLLVFYLTISSENITVDCSALGSRTNKPIFEFISLAENLPDKIPSCGDGTKYGHCSANKPGYCYAGSVYSKCDLCGCPVNSRCGKSGKCDALAQNITCFKDLDCGQNDFTGDYYCTGSHISRNYTNYTCQNPGTVNSRCAAATGSVFLTYCNPIYNQVCAAGKNTCQTTINDSAPTVSISVNPTTAAQGQFFNVTVIGTDDVGLVAIWWWVTNSSDSELNKAHWYSCNGARACTYSWLVSTNATGTLTLGANSRDTAYPVAGQPHQASEGQGIAYAYLTVTGAVSNVTSIDTLTVKGRIIDRFSGKPLANIPLQLLKSGYINIGTFSTNANGEFAITTSTTDITQSVSKSIDYTLVYGNCYINDNGIAISRYPTSGSLADFPNYQPGAIYLWMNTFDLSKTAKYFAVSGPEVNIGDVALWPSADISINSDVLFGFNIDYPEDGGSTGNSGYALGGYLRAVIPLNYNVRVKLFDSVGNNYYSPYTNVPLSNGCNPVYLNFYNNQFAWNITSTQANATNQTTLQAPSNIIAGWGITNDNTKKSSLFFHAINFNYADPLPSSFRVYLKKPGESIFSRVVEFTGLSKPCETSIYSGPYDPYSTWTLYRRCSPTNQWKIDAALLPTTSYSTGAYRFYVSAVDSSGKENSSQEFEMYNLPPLSVSSPTSAQSPVASNPTFQWTVASGWPKSPIPYSVQIFDDAKFGAPWIVHSTGVNVPTSSTTASYVYDGPALDPAKKYVVRMYGLSRAYPTGLCPSCDYISMDTSTQTFWVSGNQTNITTCTDSDGGFNIYKAGLTDGRVNGIGQYFYDTCVHSNGGACSDLICAAVAEGYCADGKVTNLLAQCPNGCQNGACINQTCTDSDGGRNYYVKGTATGSINAYDTSTDFCSGNYVTESFCLNGIRYQESYLCAVVCSDGACVNQTTSKPDLIVSNITFSPANPTTADYTSVYFIIKNIGSATAWNFSTKVEYVGGQSFLFGTGALQPGATTQTGSLANYWPAGTNTFKATVDINNNVAELDENNNALTKSVTVLSTTNQTTLKGYAETCADGAECKYNMTCISDPLDNNVGKCGWWGSTGTFSQCSAGYYPSTPCQCGSMAIYAGACNHGIFYWPPTQAGSSVGSSCTDSTQCSTGICIFGKCSYAVRCHPQTPGYCHDHEECVAFGASC